MNCYFTCQKLSKICETCFTATKETALASFNLAGIEVNEYGRIILAAKT